MYVCVSMLSWQYIFVWVDFNNPLCGVDILLTQPVFVGLVDPMHFGGLYSSQSNILS